MVSSGAIHSCGLRSDGSTPCWEGHYPKLAAPPEGEVLAAISSGFYQTCGLRADGSAVCWWNFGEPDSFDRSFLFLSTIFDYGQTVPPEGGQFTSISVGDVHTCGLRGDGSGTCWWNVDLPRLQRDRPAFGSVMVPHDAVAWPEGETFIAISSGSLHTCGLRPDGSVLCWGNTNLGQAPLPEGDIFTAISSGYDYVCGMRSEGTVVCRGQERLNVG